MLHWILALLITFGAAYYQRKTGPTYPVVSEVSVGGETLRVKLLRSHGGEGDQPVVIEGAPAGVSARVLWRRFPTSEEYGTVEMVRTGSRLEGTIPHQPPAGKIEYRVEISDGTRVAHAPDRGTVVTRFKGAVPAVALIPHILFMFAGMLLSNRAGIEAVRGGGRLRGLTAWTLALLFLGGLVFGPIVQKYAFGSYWTGIPFGYDLTDNKTLIAFLGWLIALRAVRKGTRARAFVIGAALITFAVFLIPHSVLGSELKPE
jgi:hypothetical protein